MREWDEITRDVLRRRDEKIAQKKAQMQTVKRTALTALCFCVVSAAGFGVWKNLPDREKPSGGNDSQQLITDDPSSVIDEKTETDAALSEEDKVTAAQKKTAAITTASKKTQATTSAAADKTSVSRTTVTQSRAVTSRITEAAARTEMSVPVVTTDINVPVNETIISDERNVIMKKFFAALAAASTMAAPITANASPILRFDPDRNKMYDESQYSMYESGSEKTDLNGDGKFDVQDLYYDVVENGNETSQLVSYYIYKNGLNPEDYNIENFMTEDNSKLSEDGWYFFLNFGSWMSSDMKYKEIVKYDKEHDVSLDFNADGAADVKDLLDYWLFTEYLSYGSYLKDTEYKNEIAEKYGVDLNTPVCSKVHRLYSITGKALPDIETVIPEDKYSVQIPLDETTLKNCAQHLIDHWFTISEWDDGEIMLTREFVNCCGFTEEWLDAAKCEEYLYSRVDDSFKENDRFKETVDTITGKLYDGYNYSYMGEARVDAIESGFIKYEDYSDILSWHCNNNDYFDTTYPDYEKAVQSGKTSEPDMNGDGILDDKDMEILSSCFHDTGNMFNDTADVIDLLGYKVNLTEGESSFAEAAIKALDCDDNGTVLDDYDMLFAGIYITKNGSVNFDLYSEFFASPLYINYDERTWRYYDRNSDACGNILTGQYYYDYIIALADLLFDMDKANDNAPDPSEYSAPVRSGDASLDGDTNISDAVLVMQTICNPSKYQLSQRGSFNADVNNTNDGITVKDALGIQMKLLGL